MKKKAQLAAFTFIVATAAISLTNVKRDPKMSAQPMHLSKFVVNDPPPKCGNWKDSMPRERLLGPFQKYLAARQFWRSRVEYQFTRAELQWVLTEVRDAADAGDWGARALLAHFYRTGLGPFDSNHVLDPDSKKYIDIVNAAARAGQAWGYYDLAVAYEQGFGGAAVERSDMWAHYKHAAILGSPDAQMALAHTYEEAGRPDAAKEMIQCAYRQGHPSAAYQLSIEAGVLQHYRDELQYCQDGVRFGSKDCAASLELLFDGHSVRFDEEKAYAAVGVVVDYERAKRYEIIGNALDLNPDLKLPRIDEAVPLPPAKLKPWKGIEDALPLPSDAAPTY